MDSRIPVIIVCGFLGSGKTTLLRAALQHPSLAGTALLINEVAELGVDDRLLREGPSPVVLMANGCLCCTASDDLRQELRALLELDLDAALRRRIVIETSGLADPLPAIATISSDPYLSNHLRVDLVLTLVDCLHSDASETATADYRRQIQAADVVLLTKSDLASAAQIEAARDLVARICPIVACCLSSERPLHDIIADPPVLRADRLAAQWQASSDAGGHAHAHGADAAHDHELRPVTFCLRFDHELDWMRFAIWLSLLLHRHGDRILRIKGFVAVEQASAPVVINCIHHLAYFPEHLDRWPDGDRASFLVFVVRGLEAETIVRSLRASLPPGCAPTLLGKTLQSAG